MWHSVAAAYVGNDAEELERDEEDEELDLLQDRPASELAKGNPPPTVGARRPDHASWSAPVAPPVRSRGAPGQKPRRLRQWCRRDRFRAKPVLYSALSSSAVRVRAATHPGKAATRLAIARAPTPMPTTSAIGTAGSGTT